MKGHILHTLIFGFFLFFVARAAKVSSTVAESSAAPASNLEHLNADEAPSASLDPSEALSVGGEEVCLQGDILDVVMRDREAIEAREIALASRESTLKALEARLSVQIEQTETATAALQTQIETLNTLANEDIAHLVTMYETMKPKQAAKIFDSMDPAFSSGFLRAMDSRKAGLILAEMNERKSYAVSLLIAKRNANFREAKD